MLRGCVPVWSVHFHTDMIPASLVLLVLFALSTALGAHVTIKINEDASTASYSSYTPNGATPAPAHAHAQQHHHANAAKPTEPPPPPAMPDDRDVHCTAEILKRVSLAGGAHFTLRENDHVVGKGELLKRNVPPGASHYTSPFRISSQSLLYFLSNETT